MKKLNYVFVCLLLASCYKVEWVNESVSYEQRRQDIKQCEYEASKATAGISNGIEAGWQMGTLKTQCLEAKGYSQHKVSNN